MPRRKFSEQDIEALAANPYGAKVTPSQISFTAQFRSYMRGRLEAGTHPMDVFRECGYDSEVLGQTELSARRMPGGPQRERGILAKDRCQVEGRRQLKQLRDPHRIWPQLEESSMTWNAE